MASRQTRLGRTTRVRALATMAASLVTTAVVTISGPAQAGPGLTEYRVPVPAESFRFSPGTGGVHGQKVILWANGAATTFVTTTSVTRRLSFTAWAQQCDGAPRLEVAVDGVTYLSREVWGSGNYAVAGTWPPGRHQITYRFVNDRLTTTCDRNVTVAYADLSAYATGAVHPVSTIQILDVARAEIVPAAAGHHEPGRAVVTDDAVLSFRLDSQGSRNLSLSLDAAVCDGRRATVVASLDGSPFYSGEVPAPYWEGIESYLGSDQAFPNGTHEVTLTLSGMRSGDCVRTLSLNQALFSGLV